MLVRFGPDPTLEDKRKLHERLGIDSSPLAEPVPILGGWEYSETFKKVVRPLAEKEPLATAVVLATVLDEMVQLRMGGTNGRGVWRRRRFRGLVPKTRPDKVRSFEEPSNVLVECLTFACERVFEQTPSQAIELDGLLRTKRVENFQAIAGTSLSTLPWRRDQELD